MLSENQYLELRLVPCNERVSVNELNISPLPITRLHYQLECQVATAFITCTMECRVPKGWPQGDLVTTLFFPHHHDSTITNVYIENIDAGKVFTTRLIPSTEAEKYASKKISKNEPAKAALPQSSSHDPELLTLTIGRARAGQSYLVRVTLLQPLQLDANGAYTLQVASTLPEACIPPGVDPRSIIDYDVSVTLGRLAQPVFVHHPWHPMALKRQFPGGAEYTCDRSAAPEAWAQNGNADIQVSYAMWSDEVLASCRVRPAPDLIDSPAAGRDDRGDFLVMVSPTRPEATKPWARSVVFVVDRSGSMAGEPMASARESVKLGVAGLTEADQFNIIAFDDLQMSFAPGLVSASAEAREAACAWVDESVTARGMTDIMTPLSQALDMLAAAVGLPHVFLLTDGAVKGEQAICTTVSQRLAGLEAAPVAPSGLCPRVSTLAIGRFCNHFFLRQLAVTGRGQFDLAFRPHAIKAQMQRLVTAAAMPILASVALGISDVSDVELFPFPIPDLCCGRPIVVAGKFRGTFPASLELTGSEVGRADRFSKVFKVPDPEKHPCTVPIELAWLCTDARQKQALIDQIVSLSYASNIPTAHTMVVGFECAKGDYEKAEKEHRADPSRGAFMHYAVGGLAGVTLLGGMAAVMAFGDVGATAGNLLSGDLASDAVTGLADAFASMDFGGMADGIVAGIGSVGEGLQDCLGSMCEVMSSCAV